MRYSLMIYIFPILMIILFATATFNMADAADEFGARFGTTSASAFNDPSSPNLMAASPKAPATAFDDPNFDPSSIANIEPAAGESADDEPANEAAEPQNQSAE